MKRVQRWGLGLFLLVACALVGALARGTRRPAPRAPAKRGAFSLRLPEGPGAPGVPEASPLPPRRQNGVRGSAATARAAERAARAARPDREATPRELAVAAGWTRCLAVHKRLPRAGAAGQLAQLQDALGGAANPVVRQNLIFLAVLTLPGEVAYPWLRALTDGEDAGDREDALVALAFDGDAGGRALFARLASAASPARVRRLVDTLTEHEALGREGTPEARAVLRSYRAIEVLDRRAYFKFTPYLTRHRAWRPHPVPGPELRLELAPRWLARYPGHPGSDDLALRTGRLRAEKGEHFAAARWYSRAAALPDQDLVDVAVGDLIATCELRLSPPELDRLAHEQGYDTPNRALVLYIRLRRLAAERGFDVAVRLAAALGRDEPDSTLGYAWNHRRAARAPRGLDSGLTPLAADDPLRAVEKPAAPPPAPEGAPPPRLVPGAWRYGPPQDEPARLHPWPEALRLQPDLVMRQLRAWETLAELEQRAARTRGEKRADLLYKQAAVFFHDPRVLFPVYGRQTLGFRHLLRAGDHCDYGDDSDDSDDSDAGASLARFERTSYGLLRAIALFRRIERDHPRYAGLDKVLFSQGLAWKKLLTYRPYAPYDHYFSEDEATQRRIIFNAVASLQRCADLFPESPLAAGAARAVAYWRRTRPDAFAATQPGDDDPETVRDTGETGPYEDLPPAGAARFDPAARWGSVRRRDRTGQPGGD